MNGRMGPGSQRRQRRRNLLTQELESMLDSEVVVMLKNGRILQGTLKAYDPLHLNVVLYNAREQAVSGEIRYSRLVIRGDSIEFIALLGSR